MRRVRYFSVLETDAERIRVDFETERGQVIVSIFKHRLARLSTE